MKNEKPFLLRTLEKALKGAAVLVLKKYKPEVIGITGSVGKTSSKEAISCVLGSHFSIREGEKNYNNEIGIPLTIIGSPSGGRSIFGWLAVFVRWIRLIILPSDYPKILILEMGADRPGDIRYLTGFVKPKIGVLTDISGSHLEFFKSLEGVAREKGVLIKSLVENGTAVLNIDNPYIQKIKEQTKANVLTFGFSQEAEVRVEDVFYSYSNGSLGSKEISGLSFKLSYKGTTLPVRLNSILARHSVYSALAGVSTGIVMGMNLIEIGAALSDFRLPPGRMTLLKGIKNTFLIDDSYNASPVSTKAALSVLEEVEAKRKIAVLGDMLELGKESPKDHAEIIGEFLKSDGGRLLLVGRRMREAAEKILEKTPGEKGRISIFFSPEEAGKKLQEIMKEGDLVLIKGSQGMRMEKIVEEVMAEPERASEFLCRQDLKWKNKPWKEV